MPDIHDRKVNLRAPVTRNGEIFLPKDNPHAFPVKVADGFIAVGRADPVDDAPKKADRKGVEGAATR